MSAEDLGGAAIDAFNRCDREAVERLLASDSELVSPMSEIRGRPYEGHLGARWIDDLNESFAILDAVLDELVEVAARPRAGTGPSAGPGPPT